MTVTVMLTVTVTASVMVMFTVTVTVGMCDCCLEGIEPCECKGNIHPWIGNQVFRLVEEEKK